MTQVRFLPPAAKYIKKLKDEKLKKLFRDAVDEISRNPEIAEEKHGDFLGIRSYDVFYNRVNYELAYTIEYLQRENSNEVDVVVVIMAGTRENFYDEFKRYLKERAH